MSNKMSSHESIVEEDQANIILHKLNNNKSDKLLTKAMNDIIKVKKQHQERLNLLRKDNDHTDSSVN